MDRIYVYVTDNPNGSNVWLGGAVHFTSFGISGEAEVRVTLLWVEALALGNGRLAAMVFGGVPEERTPRGTPELARAASVSLNERGEITTGWATAWRISAFITSRLNPRFWQKFAGFDAVLLPALAGVSVGTSLRLARTPLVPAFLPAAGSCFDLCSKLYLRHERVSSAVMGRSAYIASQQFGQWESIACLLGGFPRRIPSSRFHTLSRCHFIQETATPRGRPMRRASFRKTVR